MAPKKGEKKPKEPELPPSDWVARERSKDCPRTHAPTDRPTHRPWTDRSFHLPYLSLSHAGPSHKLERD